eukprot:14052772-Ditylum_brightwellii.AAC.1
MLDWCPKGLAKALALVKGIKRDLEAISNWVPISSSSGTTHAVSVSHDQFSTSISYWDMNWDSKHLSSTSDWLQMTPFKNHDIKRLFQTFA